MGAPFTVTLARTGRTVYVSEYDTIVEALKSAGVSVPTHCRFGACGTCQTTVLAGEPEHRDLCLDETSRQHSMITCVSRSASSAPLVLDL
ncbi:2Fe-2S iron-sulfur cluster binding domain-containing protein [Arthrobacter sp. SLBN-53]|uniref:2Fe-2S iron-sulfur cluster-binding protein n=1 Tax=Arthrobacter sp. SLBN-53 TaxID=2768412 RepID=UPI001C20B09F|nr:2Fe-2S iron-sulfur cluster binding domain-containing protein [Arthrobacter sp. SLBN-53]